MFLPDPTHRLCVVVLVPRKPQLTLHTNNVKNLAWHVDKVRYTALSPIMRNVELEETSCQEEDFRFIGIGRRGGQFFDRAADRGVGHG
jgi:hypothetical protein